MERKETEEGERKGGGSGEKVMGPKKDVGTSSWRKNTSKSIQTDPLGRGSSWHRRPCM